MRAALAVLAATLLLGAPAATAWALGGAELRALAAPPTTARALDGAELRALAARARHDRAALARLRAVREVDGRAVDLGAALRGARGEQLDARLRALAAAPVAEEAPPLPPGAARERARAILREDRFRARGLPRPLAGPLNWLGERLAPVGRAVRDAFAAAARVLPGGSATVWALIGAVVLAVAAAVAARLARRRARDLEGGRLDRRGGAADGRDPRALEREADRAERAGDAERAVRLRFRAGLLRLDAARVLPFDPALTTGAVARRLRSPEFDALAARFDEIAYGHRPAAAHDARAAREGWQRVLAQAGRDAR